MFSLVITQMRREFLKKCEKVKNQTEKFDHKVHLSVSFSFVLVVNLVWEANWICCQEIVAKTHQHNEQWSANKQDERFNKIDIAKETKFAEMYDEHSKKTSITLANVFCGWMQMKHFSRKWSCT